MPHTSTTLPEERPPPSNTPPKNESNDDEEMAERRRIQESLSNMEAEVQELKRLWQELDAEERDALFEAYMEDSEKPDAASSQTEAVAPISQDTSTSASIRDPTPSIPSAPQSAQLSHLDSERQSQCRENDAAPPMVELQGRESIVLGVEGRVGDILDYGYAVDDERGGRDVRVGESVVWDFEVVDVRLGEGGWVLWEDGKGEGGG